MSDPSAGAADETTDTCRAPPDGTGWLRTRDGPFTASNARVPDEWLHIDQAKRITESVAPALDGHPRR